MMNDEKEDPILAAPNPPKEAEEQQQLPSTNIPEEKSSDDKEQIRLNYDQRRISLLNNPTYGIILAFLDKFRAHIDIQDYPLHLLEENLLNDQENISRRLIDFHLTLLKRISLGKGAQRDKFVSIITKFAYRFDYNDGEYLKIHGYSQADIDIKLRILKNLLETQFDHNQTFKTALLEKPSFEIRSQAFGRDRSGAFYWLFMDSECFVRLFRENIDDDRTWVNIAKDKDELECFIKLLITDNGVRKKFPDWKFAHESFNSLESSNEFQERYIPNIITIKKEEERAEEVKVKPSKRAMTVTASIKLDRNLVVKMKNKSPSPPPIKNEVQSDEESSNSVDKISQHSTIPSSEDVNNPAQEINNNQDDKQLKKARGRRKSKNWNKKKRRTVSNPLPKKEEPPPEETKSPTKGRKRKHIIDTDEESRAMKKNEQTSQKKEIEDIPFDEELLNDDNLPIALRRSRRTRKVPTNEPPAVTSSPTKSVSQTPTKKKLTNGKSQNSSQTIVKSSQSSKTTTTKKNRKGRRRGKNTTNGASSSSDEHQPSEEEDEEYNSDDYLPDKKQADELDEDDLYEEEDEDYTPRRSAKTVAKRRGQLTEDIQGPSSACCVCSKTDRPESLLLCDDCDDAYHLECLKPILLAVPDGDWYCPLCEHKRLCDNLIEKFIQLLKEYEELEVKRNQTMSKRTNRLANVMLNLDRMVKRSSKKRRTNGIVYSDEENEDDEPIEDEEDEPEEEEDENQEEDDDNDSVYGFKDDSSINGKEKSRRTSNSRRGGRDVEEPERLGVRSCRRKPQNYRFDDYDKKMKEAMIDAGEDGDEIDKDLAESDEEEEDDGEKKATKKRNGYEKDEDFDASDAKNDDEFAPDQTRSDESGSEDDEDDYDDEESSDDGAWRSKRRTSSRKKPPPRSTRRKTRNKKSDDDDDSLSDADLENFQSFNTTKSETTNDLDLSEHGNDDRRRSSRATTQKNYAKQENDDESDAEEEEDLYEDGRPPPRRMRYKKRRGSDDSFIDDDDYEKIARKRKIVQYGKTISRSSITDHLKNFVNEEEQATEEKVEEDEMHVDTNDSTKEPMKKSATEYNEQPSDDDDFPDEQEIFQANGLLKFQRTINAPRPPTIRPAFPAPTHSYQHAIIDPTARFTMIRPPVRPNGYPMNGHDLDIIPQPSDSNPINGHNNLPS